MTTYIFDLVKFPNQTFSTTANGNSLEIALRTFRGIIYANITVNGTLVEAGRRCLANERIFSKSVEQAIGGNFRFVCETDDYPNYQNFDGKSCVLSLEVD